VLPDGETSGALPQYAYTIEVGQPLLLKKGGEKTTRLMFQNSDRNYKSPVRTPIFFAYSMGSKKIYMEAVHPK